MTYTYALQVAGVALAMGLLALVTLKVASANFDRHTRESEERGPADHRPS